MYPLILTIVHGYNLISATPRGMLDLERHRQGHMSQRKQAMVHKGLSKQIWMACPNRPCVVHHLLLSGDGDSALDCQLRDLPSSIPRHLRRNSSHSQLDLKSHCCPILLVLNTSHWDFLDIPHFWGDFSCGPFVCSRLRSRDEGTSH